MQLFDMVRERFAQRVPPRARPATFVPILPVEDDGGEAGSGDPVGDAVNGLSVIIAYRDTKGIASLRQVSCIRVDRMRERRYLHAFCHERRAYRRFVVDQIEAVHDVETGEELADGDEFFAAFQDDRIEQSQPGWGLSPVARADIGAGLTMLAFLSRCDGHVDPLETAEIETFAAAWWIRSGVAAVIPEDDIAAHVRRLAPDVESFVVASMRVRGDAVLRHLVAGYARRLVEADGRIAPEEHHWIIRVSEWLDAQ